MHGKLPSRQPLDTAFLVGFFVLNSLHNASHINLIKYLLVVDFRQ